MVLLPVSGSREAPGLPGELPNWIGAASWLVLLPVGGSREAPGLAGELPEPKTKNKSDKVPTHLTSLPDTQHLTPSLEREVR